MKLKTAIHIFLLSCEGYVLPHFVDALHDSPKVPRAQLSIFQEELFAVHSRGPQLVWVSVRTLVHLCVHWHGLWDKTHTPHSVITSISIQFNSIPLWAAAVHQNIYLTNTRVGHSKQDLSQKSWPPPITHLCWPYYLEPWCHKGWDYLWFCCERHPCPITGYNKRGVKVQIILFVHR